MNVKEIREAFEALTNESIDNATLLIWLNEAQEDLAAEYGPVDQFTYCNAKANKEYDLPENYLSAIEVRDKENQKYLSFEITEWGKIRFLEDGDYTVYYHRIPKRLKVGDDNLVPEIHELLHAPMYLYAAAMYFNQESDGDSDELSLATKYMNQYANMKYDRVQKLKSRAHQPKKVRAVTWR